MSFFEQMGQKLTQTSQDAVKKTKDMAEVVRLNNAVSEEQKKIENIYREIGKLYYEHFADKEEEIFREGIAEIRRSEASIQDMKVTIRQLKGLQACPVCGNELPFGQAFCNACGAKMPELAAEPAQPEIVDGVRCPSCGTVMEKGMAFCTNCGTKLEA